MVIHVARASDGEELAAKGPLPYTDLLDVDAKKVVLGNDRRTFAWGFVRDRTRTLARGMSGDVDLSLDLMTSWTKDPYEGGCMVVSRLSSPPRSRSGAPAASGSRRSPPTARRC